MPLKLRLTLISICCLATLRMPAQKLNSTEKKIVKAVEANHPEAINFLEKVVNINSGTMNHQGVKETGMVFMDEFLSLGLTAKWVTMPEEVDRAGHLVAEQQGARGKRMLLIGHLDTVFDKDSPFQKFIRQDSIAMGPGTNDMKGGNVIILYALKALSDAGALKGSQIIVVLHGDEESAGKPIEVSRKDIIAAAQRSDVALGFETSSGFNYATVARRGSSGWRLEVTGKQAHSSGIFNEKVGAGAIFEASRILNGFYDQLSAEEYLTFNPGVILGGTRVMYEDATNQGTAYGKSNIVPQKVVVKGGLRFISEEQKEKARERMREIVAGHLPHTAAKITFTDSYPAMPPTDGNMALLQVLNQVSLDLQQGPVKAYDPGKRGAADISFVAQYVDGLDGLGSMGRGAHSPNEYVDLTTFEDLTKRAALLIYRLSSP